jgi:hypothetical protein
MPYIGVEKREEISPAVMELMTKLESKGDYNYAISLLVHTYIQRKGLRYEHLNDVIGILECAKQEFIRTVVNPYEDEKAQLNGSVSELDAWVMLSRPKK